MSDPRKYSPIVAEQILLKHSHPAAWCWEILGIKLDPLQLLRWDMLDKHRHTVSWDARRMRKTTTIFLHALKWLATHSHEFFLAVTPKEQQAQDAMEEYMLMHIRDSEVLRAFIQIRGGRKQISDRKFTFANNSTGRIAGIYSEVDGKGVSYCIYDEAEDLDQHRLLTKFLPMHSQSEKIGANRQMEPQIRFSGVIKGSGLRKILIDKGYFPMTQPNYPKPPIIGNVNLGVQLGILREKELSILQSMMAPDDWTRQMLCLEVESDSVIKYSHVRRAMTQALEWAEPAPGKEYKKRGVVSIGYDHLGHGEQTTSSRSALVVCEMVGEFVTFPYVKTWPAWADETRDILPDLVNIWRYFRPDAFFGDAYGIGLLTAFNDELYRFNLTSIDRRAINEGRSTESSWPEWAAAPVRFGGLHKHNMVDALRILFEREYAKIPWFDDAEAMREPLQKDRLSFIKQLANVIKLPTKANYPSYKMDSKEIGDDIFDAACAAVWGVASRGMIPGTVILTSTRPAFQLGRGVEYLPGR